MTVTDLAVVSPARGSGSANKDLAGAEKFRRRSIGANCQEAGIASADLNSLAWDLLRDTGDEGISSHESNGNHSNFCRYRNHDLGRIWI